MRRSIIIENFLEHSTIHGVYFIKTPKTKVKASWLLIVLLASMLIILSTILMVDRYLTYNHYLISEEQEVSKLEDIPNLLICSTNKVSMFAAIMKHMPELNVSSTSTYMNFSFIEELKHRLLNFHLERCSISIKSQRIDCMKFRERVIFTFSGLCLLLDFQELKQNETLLFKELNVFRYLNRYKIKISVTFDYSKLNESNYDALYFHLVSGEALDTNFDTQLVLYSTNRSERFKYYDIIPQYTEYSSSLWDKKCKFDNYNEFSCHFECLQHVINNLLHCYFTLIPSSEHESSVPYCSVNQLPFIEEIIKNYTYWRGQLECGKCLPNCRQLSFNAFEASSFERVYAKGFVWNFYLNFKVKEMKYVLNFDSAELLNFINGLWSLFLGISVLSVWEIVEFFYALAGRCKWRVKLESDFRKVKSLYHAVFRDTYLHGFKSLLIPSYSKLTQFRWVLVITIAFIGFFFAIANAVAEYTQYNSDFKKSIQLITGNEKHANRKLTVFLCKPLQLSNTNNVFVFNELDKMAEQLFQSNNNLSINEIIETYGNFMTQETNENISAFSTYSTIFKKSFVALEISLISGERKYKQEGEIYYRDECYLFETDVLLKDAIRINSNYIISTGFHASIDPIIKVDLFLLDHESLHMQATSRVELVDGNIPNLVANLKYKKLLSSPFKPSCNRKRGYKQHECFQECFNSILFKTFGCKVVYGELKEHDEDSYCHPMMLPLISKFEKYVLRGFSVYQCDYCKEPCEFFYYDLDLSYRKDDVSNAIRKENFRFNQFVEYTEQSAIVTFQDVLIIIVSYLSLFFGGSILAIVQITFNVVSNSKIMQRVESYKLQFLKKFTVFDYIAKLTSIHCAKYVSLTSRNDFKKLFWMIAISGTAIAGISLTVMEAMRYKSSRFITQMEKSSDKRALMWPKLDICRSIDEPLSFINGSILSDFYANSYFIKKSFNMSFSNVPGTVRIYHERYEKSLFSNYSGLLKITTSSVIDEYMKNHLGNISLSRGIKWKMSELSSGLKPYAGNNVKIYQTSILHDERMSARNGFLIDICKTIDLYDEEEIINNPFVYTENSQLTIEYDQFDQMRSRVKDYSLYIDDYLLSPLTEQLERYGHFKAIKSMLRKYNYNYGCKNKNKCISNQKVLREYTEYELFLCNDELKETVYEVFNCTPFINTTNRVPECSIGRTLVINEIMSKFKQELFKCEISSALFPIEFDNVPIPLVESYRNKSLIGIDFNRVMVYSQNIVEEYDLLQLIVNLSNWLNVLSGFSFITICELAFICTCGKYCIA